jgi:hypothetical protein
VWQELRSELHPRGLEIVTVALDTGGAAAAGKWIEAARPEHPALIDAAHVCDELFGIVNVPSGVWIDETGVIVRPPETAYPRRPPFLDTSKYPEVRGLRIDAERYVAALRDWVANGARSRHALAPDEVVRRSRPRPPELSAAAAHFELAQHLHRDGRDDLAVDHFREAQRLDPANWTYRRQAWSLAGTRRQELYGTDWLTEVRRIGAENYYSLPIDDIVEGQGAPEGHPEVEL